MFAGRNPRYGVFLLLLASLLSAGPAFGEGRVSTLGLYERWDDERTPSHGAVMARWDERLGPQFGRLAIEYNTDTLTLEYVQHPISRLVTFGVRLRGEVGAANLSLDYFREGQSIKERGFLASYVHLDSWLRVRFMHHGGLSLHMAGRSWFFGRLAGTAEGFTLPSDTPVFEPSLAAYWWRLRGDAGWQERHRVFPRLHGYALGMTVGTNMRRNARAWGLLADPEWPEVRNRPRRVHSSVRQWLMAGWKPHGRVRLQTQQELGAAWGEDDLYRRVIGGLNPYAVDLPGFAWGHFHSGDYAALQSALRWLASEALEAGPMFAAVVLRDPGRRGDRAFGMAWGVGGELDWRLGEWQLNVRGGIAPDARRGRAKHLGWSGVLVLGWGQERAAKE